MEGAHRGYGTEGYSSRSDTYQGHMMGRDVDVTRDQGTGTTGTAGAGTGGGMMAKAKEMLVDRPVEAVKVRGR
jgi:hypothetical protein